MDHEMSEVTWGAQVGCGHEPGSVPAVGWSRRWWRKGGRVEAEQEGEQREHLGKRAAEWWRVGVGLRHVHCIWRCGGRWWAQ